MHSVWYELAFCSLYTMLTPLRFVVMETPRICVLPPIFELFFKSEKQDFIANTESHSLTQYILDFTCYG